MSVDSSPLSSALSSPIDVASPSFFKDGALSPLPSMHSSPEPPEDTKSPAKKKRSPSPPHEEVLADNPDIAFLVMFRARFSDAFPPKLMHFGPQDIEQGVVDNIPSPQVQDLLCALLGLVLNRKKPVERGHHNRALEDALSTQKAEWPKEWNGINPISGSKSFNTMNPHERLTLLRALVMWSLHSSEAISNIIKESYKQNRQEDDGNQPLSVQPWGRDGDKRRYWLIEGRDDTPFRLYRESNPALKTNHTWWSMAGTIEELQVVAEKLEKEGSQSAKRLGQRIIASLPRFEATEEKRKRREYRQARKAQFSRPEPGFSMYEGRTRGKRMKYTYSDNEEEYDDSDIPDDRGLRRSARGADASNGAMVTSSGRHVRTRFGNMYGAGDSTARESPASDGFGRSDGSEEPNDANGRPTRSRGTLNGWVEGRSQEVYNDVDEMDEDSDAVSSGEEWQGEDEMGDQADEEDDEMSDATDEGLEPQSLVVKLQYRKDPSMAQRDPSTPQKEKQPHLAYREAPTPTSTHVPKPLEVQNTVLPPVTARPASNGVAQNGHSPSQNMSSPLKEDTSNVTLPSFSKFIYNSAPAQNQTPLPTSENTQSTPGLPTPPTTSQPPFSTHNRPW